MRAPLIVAIAVAVAVVAAVVAFLMMPSSPSASDAGSADVIATAAPKVHIVPPENVVPPKPKIVLPRDLATTKKSPGPMPGKEASDDKKLAWLKAACPKAPCLSDVKSFDARRKRTQAPADERELHTAVQACMQACAYR